MITTIPSNLIGRKLTPQQKASAVNQIMGNPNIKDQQGTTRVVYDRLPADGTLVLEFFEGVQARAFPFTNLNQNKLQVGETLILQRISFHIMEVDAVTGDPTDVTTFAIAGVPQFYAAQFSVVLDTITVVKPIPLVSTFPSFNYKGWNAVSEVYQFDSLIDLPTDIQFKIRLQLPPYVAIANTFIGCAMEGFGTLLSPKTQM